MEVLLYCINGVYSTIKFFFRTVAIPDEYHTVFFSLLYFLQFQLQFKLENETEMIILTVKLYVTTTKRVFNNKKNFCGTSEIEKLNF